MQKNTKQRFILAAVCLALSVFMLAGITYAWLSKNIHVNAGNTVTSADSGDEYTLGHDTYKWDLTNACGVLMNGTIVEMNQYDTIFVENNPYTPIILRAVLSKNYADTLKNNEGTVTLSLTSTPIETIKKNNPSADLFARDTAHTGGYTDIEDYLSNVVNVRAAYIPGLVENAESGNYAALDDNHTYTCTEENDYIYQYAVDYFEKYKSTITPVKFVETSSTDEDQTTTTTAVTYVVTAVNKNNYGVTASSDKNVSYELLGYLIGNGTNFLNGSLGSTAFSGAGTYTSAIDSSILWTLNSSTVQISPGSTLYNNNSGKYLYLSSTQTQQQNPPSQQGGQQTYSLAVSTSSTNWTLNSDLRRITNSNQYVYCSNGTWGVSNDKNSANATIYKVEKCTTTTTTTTKVPVYSYNHTITINVNLNQAQADNGNYYVYLMIDYDVDLIQSYFSHNGMTFAIGQTGTTFEDYFSISPVISESST